MKRIAYLCSEYPALSHTFIFREICSLREEGIEVLTVSVNPPSHLEKMSAEEQQDAAETLVMKAMPPWQIMRCQLRALASSPGGYLRMMGMSLFFWRRGRQRVSKILGYLVEAGILVDWLRQNGVQHIHEHFGNPTALVALLAMKYGAGFSYSLSIHGPDIFYTVDSSLLREKIENAIFVRSISHYCSSQLMRLTSYGLWSNFHIIRCGIDPALYTARPLPDNESMQLLCVGRLVPAKGQHILLQACSKLLQKGFRLHLSLVGTGEDEASLRQVCQELQMERHITFAGAMGQEQVRDFYDLADIFVLPSFAEGVPVVLMEAMAKEIPVVSTRITGIPELIAHGEDGLLATPGDVDDLVKQICLLLDNADLRVQLGKAGRIKVQKYYSSAENNREMAEIFLRLH